MVTPPAAPSEGPCHAETENYTGNRRVRKGWEKGRCKECGHEYYADGDDAYDSVFEYAEHSLHAHRELAALRSDVWRLTTERNAMARSFIALRACLLEGSLELGNDRDYEAWQAKVAEIVRGSRLAFDKAMEWNSEPRRNEKGVG